MASVNTWAGDVRLVGGRLCLDFLNTVNHLPRGDKEYLHSYADLLVWLRHAGALDEGWHTQLLTQAERHPGQATAALATALQFRSALERLFDRLPQGHPPDLSDLAPLNMLLSQLVKGRIVVGGAGRLHWETTAGPDLGDALWPIVWSAAELLTSPAVQNVHMCAGEGCSWRFLDTTPGRTRLWCSMEDCGNRAKARRHYARRSQQ